MTSKKQKLVLVASGCLLGLSLGLSPTLTAKSKTDPEELPIKDVQRFTTAISQIKSYYVQPVKDEKLFENAIRGMLEGLDPHSSYLDTEELKELRQTTKGEFSGLGIEVTMDKGIIKVISPIDDTPAALAGIKPGDYIIRLDGKTVRGMELRDAVNLMRGAQGTKVKLTVIREGNKEPLSFELKRDKILVRSVKGQIVDKDYGYVRLSHFQSTTAEDLKKSIQQLQQKAGGHLKGLVLDLRNNPGGLLDAAIDVSDLFIGSDGKKDELIVYTKGRLPGSDFKAYVDKTEPGDILNNAPMVVLINNGSASASEIVAGALKDTKRAVLLGTRSFGKGSVQTVLPLDADHGIKLTTALYYTPAGISIQAQGITPDIMVKPIVVDKKNQGDNGADLLDLSEADLEHHLANGNKAKVGVETPVVPAPTSTSSKISEKSDDLIYSDYQLYEAMNLLKGLVLVNKGKMQAKK